MEFDYKADAVKYEYEVVYLDKVDDKCFAFVDAYSEKQAMYLVKKLYKNCERIVRVSRLKEIPPKDGKQLVMKF